MKLTKVDIRCMPGLPQGFLLENISPGMNIISGPNGIGKTTLCRAILATLWDPEIAEASVETHWIDDTSTWISERKEGRLCWYKSGIPTENPPPLPDKHLAGCIVLQVDQMLGGLTDSDSVLAKHIAQEMAGGYDIDKVRSDERLRVIIPKKMPQLEQANRDINDAVKSQASLVEQEKTLPDLLREKKVALAAAREIPHLEKALSLAKRRAEYQEYTVQMADFPAEMGHLQDGDLTELRVREEKTQNIKKECEKEESYLVAALEEIRVLDLPDDLPVPDSDIRSWEEHLRDLPTLTAKLTSAEQDASKAAAKTNEALRALLPEGASPDTLSLGLRISPELLTSAQDALDQDLTIEGRLRVLDWKMEMLHQSSDTIEIETISAGIRNLSRWLSSPEQDSTPKQSPLISVVLFGILMAAGLLTALYVKPGPAMAPVIIIATLGFILGLRAWRDHSAKAQSIIPVRRICQEEFLRLNITAPTHWADADVSSCLNELLKRSGESQFGKLIDVQRSVVQEQKMDIEHDTEQAKAKRAETERELGFCLSWKDFDKVWISRNLEAYQNARALAAEAESITGDIHERIGTLLAQLNLFLERYNAKIRMDDLNETSARTAFNFLEKRSASLTHACLRRNAARDKLDSLKNDQDKADGELAVLLSDRRCVDLGEIRERLKRYPKWKTLGEEKAMLSKQILDAVAGLKDRPDLCNLDEGQVVTKQQIAKELSSKSDDFSSKIIKIEVDIDSKKKDTEISQARVIRQRLVEQLGEKRDVALFAAAGQFLLQQTTASHTQTTSGNLERASALFKEFTNHYALHVTEKGDYRAFDHDTGKSLSLTELSGGTRVQLLMAARLAFSEHALMGIDLPLCLDETLKHSDPLRYAAIVSCLQKIVASGRQVFYLTNEPLDIQRITTIFAECGGDAPNCIDLATVRECRAGWAPHQDISLPHGRSIPAPSGQTSVEYGKLLGAPRFDPQWPAESISLHYIVTDDLECLHRLLQAGVATVGRWEDMKSAAHIRFGISPEAVAKTAGSISVARLFIEGWNCGRPKPLTRLALRDSGLPDNFSDAVSEIAQELNWDAKKVISAIRAKDPRVKGFREKTIVNMDAWLLENDYLTDEEILDADSIFNAVINSTEAAALSPQEIRLRVDQLWLYAGLAEAL